MLKTSAWRAERNARARARLMRYLPEVFPVAVLHHALGRPFIPPTPRRAIESYWRHHPVRADKLARALAARSHTPAGWSWQAAEGTAGFRLPPVPFRDTAHAKARGRCCVCGQPVFRFGWHRDLWGDGPANAAWHSACVAAWNLWTAPSDYVRHLKALQQRRCPATGTRLLKTAEVDHRVPLFKVWRDRATHAWPALLDFWGCRTFR